MPIFFLPILDGPYSAEHPTDWIQEGALFHDRADLVEDIRSGQIDPAPRQILAIDAEAGTAKDVTREFAIEVGDASIAQRIEPFDDLVRWLEKHKASYYEGPAPWFDQRRHYSPLTLSIGLGVIPFAAVYAQIVEWVLA